MYAQQIKMTAFLQERYEKEAQYFRVYDTYTPDYKRSLLTSKFYSKYQGPSEDEADPVLIDKIQKANNNIPRERYPWPLTENHRYGWFLEELVPLDRQDKRFFYPRRSPVFIKHYLKLQMEESLYPKAKFTGIPFRRQ